MLWCSDLMFYICNTLKFSMHIRMNIALNTTDSYWNLLKNLNKEAKLELIAKLSNSLLRKDRELPVSASRFYGVWSDADFKMSSDELADEIKKSREFRDNIEAF